MPAVRPQAYDGERVGTVFRYKKGSVRPAEGYMWFRPEWNEEGCIVRMNAHEHPDGELSYATPYKTQSIFSCSVHLPVVVADTDASLGYTYMRKGCGCGSCDGRYDHENSLFRPWWTPFFCHRTVGPDRACSLIGSAGLPFVAGRSPSWMPSLVPKRYVNSQKRIHMPRSHGLGGDVPLVIGLMALHSQPGQASQIFRDRKWSGNEWHGSSSAPARKWAMRFRGFANHQFDAGFLTQVTAPVADEDPRGLLVHVALDDLDHPDGTSAEMLMSYESRGVWVKG